MVELVEARGELGRGVAVGVDEVVEEAWDAGGLGGDVGARGGRSFFLGGDGLGEALFEGGGGGGGVSVCDAGFVVDEGLSEGEVADDGEGEEDAFDGEGSGGGGVVPGGDGEEADEAEFREVDTRDELAEGALVGFSAGVDVGLVAVEEVVAEGDVDEGEADSGETHH